MQHTRLTLIAAAVLSGCGSPDGPDARAERAGQPDTGRVVAMDTAGEHDAPAAPVDPHAGHGAPPTDQDRHAGHDAPAGGASTGDVGQAPTGDGGHAGHTSVTGAAAATAGGHAGHVPATGATAAPDAHAAHSPASRSQQADPHAAHAATPATGHARHPPVENVAPANSPNSAAAKLGLLVDALLNDPAVQQHIQEDPALRQLQSQPNVRQRIQPSVTDTIQVRTTIQALFAAAERADLAALDTLYAGEALTVVEGAGMDRGWAEYRDHHLAPELKEFRNFRYRPSEIEAHVAGNFAWAIFRYSIRADYEGSALDLVGRGTAILEWRGGRWVVRHTQTSSRPRRPTDPADW